MLSHARVRTPDQRNRRRPAVFGLAALALVALVTAAPTRAAMLTTSQTLSIPLTNTNWAPGTAGVASPLQFTKFDGSLGTLHSVQVSLGHKFTHDISLTFTAAATLSESTSGSQVIVNGPAGNLYLNGTPPPISESRTVSSGPYPQTVTIPTITQTGSSGPLTLTSPADLALYTGTTAGEKIGLPVLAQSNSIFDSSTGNGSGRIITNAGADVTVSYTYTPIPEPSTLAIFGLGGAALLALRNRRTAAR